MFDFTFRDLDVAALTVSITIAIRDGGAWFWRAYQRRYIIPQKAHWRVLEDQAQWYDERAEKLAAFRSQLGHEPKPDRFKLTLLMSKLDQHDKDWAMKHTDIEILRKAVADKSVECRESAGECRRSADQIEHKIFW